MPDHKDLPVTLPFAQITDANAGELRHFCSRHEITTSQYGGLGLGEHTNLLPYCPRQHDICLNHIDELLQSSLLLWLNQYSGNYLA